MPEVRVAKEGTLWWVAQSGVGNTFATAATPASGLFGFLTNLTINSAFTDTIIYDRGIPNHHKNTQAVAPTFSLAFMWTGVIPTALSGSGATVPMFALEARYSAAEMAGVPSAYYYILNGATFQQLAFAQADGGNTITVNGTCLGFVGPTASGYIK